MFMKLNLPARTTVQGVTFGTPRVGNEAWASFFDSQIAHFTRMNNKRDPVPTVPRRLIGFRHPREEIHIQLNGSAVACPGGAVLPFLTYQVRADFLLCPGDDNGADPHCSDKMVPTINQGNLVDHLGPYYGTFIGTTFCTP